MASLSYFPWPLNHLLVINIPPESQEFLFPQRDISFHTSLTLHRAPKKISPSYLLKAISRK